MGPNKRRSAWQCGPGGVCLHAQHRRLGLHQLQPLLLFATRQAGLVLDELKANPVPEIPIPPFPNYHKNGGLGKD